MKLTKTSKFGLGISITAILIFVIGSLWGVAAIDHSKTLPSDIDMKAASEFIHAKMDSFDSAFLVTGSTTLAGFLLLLFGLTVFVFGFINPEREQGSDGKRDTAAS